MVLLIGFGSGSLTDMRERGGYGRNSSGYAGQR
jgi:hypothetical protein